MSKSKVILWEMNLLNGDMLDKIRAAQNPQVQKRFYPACETSLMLKDLVGDWLNRDVHNKPTWLLDRHVEVIKQLGYEVEVQPYPDRSLGFDTEMRVAFARASIGINDFVALYKVDRAVNDFHREFTELGYEHAADNIIDYIRDYAEELGLPEGVQS
jgi:hypothetical protein